LRVSLHKAGLMDQISSTPFESIESAYEYVALLCEALDEAEQTIEQETESPSAMTGRRHLDALRLVDYKLKTLGRHLLASRRLLNDLRTLRRYLLDERASDGMDAQTGSNQTSQADAFV
jgi:hypothetical protein